MFEIRRRSEERDAEGSFDHPSLQALDDSADGRTIRKDFATGAPRTGVVGGAVGEASARASSVRAGDGRWFKEALGGAETTPLRKASDASPVEGMLRDMGRVLEVFRAEEGRDPTAEDAEFWKSYKTLIAERLGAL
jgi:hypothetical protein